MLFFVVLLCCIQSTFLCGMLKKKLKKVKKQKRIIQECLRRKEKEVLILQKMVYWEVQEDIVDSVLCFAEKKEDLKDQCLKEIIKEKKEEQKIHEKQREIFLCMYDVLKN